MKKIFLVVMCLALCGCISSEVKRQAVLNEANVNRFIQLIDEGQTTRDQEQAYIKAQGRAWTVFREALGEEAGGQ